MAISTSNIDGTGPDYSERYRITCIADGAITAGQVVQISGDWKAKVSSSETPSNDMMGIALTSAADTKTVTVLCRGPKQGHSLRNHNRRRLRRFRSKRHDANNHCPNRRRLQYERWNSSSHNRLRSPTRSSPCRRRKRRHSLRFDVVTRECLLYVML